MAGWRDLLALLRGWHSSAPEAPAFTQGLPVKVNRETEVAVHRVTTIETGRETEIPVR